MEPNDQPIQPVQPLVQSEESNQLPEHKKVGPIVVTLVVVLVLIIVALYIFASRIGQQSVDYMSNPETASTSQIQQTASIPAVTNKASDPQSLKNDLDDSINGIDDQKF